MSTPQPSTATVSPPAASAPLCAAVSMPRAMPLTIVRPACARSAESRSATARPYGVGRRVPTTPSASDLQQFDAAAREQHDGRIEDLAQRLRIARIADGHQLRRRPRPSSPAGRRRPRRCSRWRSIARRRRSTPTAFEFGARGAEDRLRSAEAVEQLIRGSGSQTRDEFQGQPVKFLVPADDWGLQRDHHANRAAGRGASWPVHDKMRETVKQEPSFFEGKSPVLVYIAKRLEGGASSGGDLYRSRPRFRGRGGRISRRRHLPLRARRRVLLCPPGQCRARLRRSGTPRIYAVRRIGLINAFSRKDANVPTRTLAPSVLSPARCSRARLLAGGNGPFIWTLATLCGRFPP